MTDGTTIKVLLMVMLLGCIVSATYVPEGWGHLRMFLARTMAVVRSTTSWPERALHVSPGWAVQRHAV